MRLPTDLTFELFMELASRDPSLEGDWIYRLEHVCYGNIDSYPEFEITRNEYLFRSFDEATAFIQLRLSDKADTYRFEITQLPLTKISTDPESPRDEGATWIYDRNGELVDYSITTWEDDPLKRCFFGRPESRMRFKKGDIVEVVGRDRVNLAIVAADGPSVDWYWNMYERCKGDYFADASDDCYYVIDGPGYQYHEHPHALTLMKPSRPIPDDVCAYFKHCLECSDTESCNDKYDARYFIARDIEDIAIKSIAITYDNDEKRHRLIKVVHDDVTDDNIKSGISANETDAVKKWLEQTMYGKTRLWYLIRNWNESERYDEPTLALDTSLLKLL